MENIKILNLSLMIKYILLLFHLHAVLCIFALRLIALADGLSCAGQIWGRRDITRVETNYRNGSMLVLYHFGRHNIQFLDQFFTLFTSLYACAYVCICIWSFGTCNVYVIPRVRRAQHDGNNQMILWYGFAFTYVKPMPLI